MVSAQAQRTLVKSPPELWAELSDPAALARHLGELGEIRITRLQPEKKIEWASEQASGTVLIKPSGWGTRVTLTATREQSEPTPARATSDDGLDPAAAESVRAYRILASRAPLTPAPEPTPAPEAAAHQTERSPELPRRPEPPPAQALTADSQAAVPRAPEPAAVEPPSAEPTACGQTPEPITPKVEAVAGPSTVSAPPSPLAEPRRRFFARILDRLRRAAPAGQAEPSASAEPDASPARQAEPSASAEPDASPRREAEPFASAEPPASPTGQAEPQPAMSAREPAKTGSSSGAGETTGASVQHSQGQPAAARQGQVPPRDAALPALTSGEPQQSTGEDVEAVLTSVLDRLGSAHHRPFSRA